MQPVSELAILDFYEWLYAKAKRKSDPSSILDYYSDDKLVSYAEKYLYSDPNPCKAFLSSFLNSKELKYAMQYCDHRCDFYRNNPPDRQNRTFFNYCFDCEILKDAYRNFIYNYGGEQKHLLSEENIDPHALASGFQNRFSFMLSSSTMSDEINFLEWLDKEKKQPETLRKMPYSTYEMLVNEYTTVDSLRKKLQKAYKQTGWDKLFTRLKTLVGLNAHETKGINDVIERYFSEGIFKCIILPYTDPESQKIYKALINDSWKDLNDYSGQYLDIYYSEKDTGKTGYKIAEQINSLPEEITNDPPCLVLWKNSAAEAKTIPIKKLDNRDIVELIQSIVRDIKKNKDLNTIVEEANIKVKELINEKKNITNNITNNISGDSYSFDTSNLNGVVNIGSPHSTITGNTINQNKYAQPDTEDFDKALNMISELTDVNAEIKAQLTDIIKTARCGVEEKSEEKCSDARSKFATLKPMLKSYLPKALEVFANIATIAAFFGLNCI